MCRWLEAEDQAGAGAKDEGGLWNLLGGSTPVTGMCRLALIAHKLVGQGLGPAFGA